MLIDIKYMRIYRIVQLCTISQFWYSFIRPVSGQAYREGYSNSQYDMPGSSGGIRDLPSLPFSTDTNRYSDGHTSTSIYSVTSPHFPLYNGSLANITDRAKYHVSYLANANVQGIALFGDGDAVIEDAAFKIIQDEIILNKSNETLPNPNITFPVYAAIKWNPSGFAMHVGEIYRIEVLGKHTGFGSQFWNDGGIRVNANGYGSYYDAVSNCHVALGRCRSHLKKRRRLISANWMSLACAIGEFVRPVFPIIPGHEESARYVPLDESQVQESIFNVGMSLQFRANSTGELICFANDAHTLYWNNYGELRVTVTRISWPPQTKKTYYQPQYLPACDSSAVVYNENKTCNPNGGGAGWTQEEIDNDHTRYSIS
eukprot:gene1542-2979_t